MASALLFFTGTGNSLALARLLAERLSAPDPLPLAAVGEGIPAASPGDALGIVFPVYWQDCPEIVARVVRALRPAPGLYVYSVATHNGDPGYAHATVDSALKRHGSRLSAGFSVLMPGNCITPGDSTNPAGERERRVRNASAEADRIAALVARREGAPFEGTDGWRKRLKGFRNRYRFKHAWKVPASFRADGRCDGCGVCARVCPVGNVSLPGGRPAWGTRCQLCLACLHWCPREAVQNVGGTEGRVRYHHPGVTLDDMFRQGASRAAGEEGRGRHDE